MPVDKFGRTDSEPTQRVVSGGITLSQANSSFLRRDGTTRMEGDLNMNHKTIRGLPNAADDDEAVNLGQVQSLLMYAKRSDIVATPTSDNQATNKKYVDDEIVSTKKYVDDEIVRHSLLTATPNMTSKQTTIDGLTYVVSASSETHGSAWPVFCKKREFEWNLYQSSSGWIQMKYPIPISMSGFYIEPTETGLTTSTHRIISWKVQASNDGTTFTDITLPTNTASRSSTLFEEGVISKYNFPPSANYTYWRFCILATNIDSTGLNMMQWIPTLSILSERFLRRCHIGYIPSLTSNTNYCGFASSASSEASGKTAFNAFKNDHVALWLADGEPPFWLQIDCPTAVRIWKIGLRAKEVISSWKIEAFVGRVGPWVTVHTDSTNLNNVYQEFLIDSICSFTKYRWACTDPSYRTVGLKTMQLFVYDE